MVLIPNNEDFTAASGFLGVSSLEHIYHSFMDEVLLGIGRIVTFHLPPSVEEDTTTQSMPQASQFNPFFGGVPVPRTTTRGKGVKVTHRDVQYKAHIKIGPLEVDEDIHGIGKLEDNEAMITVVAEALSHVKQSQSVSIEGRRYSVQETRPIGFSTRRYLMVKLKEIQETESSSPDNTVG